MCATSSLKSSRSLSHLLMSSCYFLTSNRQCPGSESNTLVDKENENENENAVATRRRDRRRSGDICRTKFVDRTRLCIVRSEPRPCSRGSPCSARRGRSIRTSPGRSSNGSTDRYSCTLNHTSSLSIEYLTNST